MGARDNGTKNSIGHQRKINNYFILRNFCNVIFVEMKKNPQITFFSGFFWHEKFKVSHICMYFPPKLLETKLIMSASVFLNDILLL